MEIPRTMKATVLMAPNRFEVVDRPVPVPGDEDVLVRVRACGICGTDREDHPHRHAGHAALRRVHLRPRVRRGRGRDRPHRRRVPGGRSDRRRGAHGLPALRELHPRSLHRVPQLRQPQARASRQRLHHQRRAGRVRGEPRQHALSHSRRRLLRGSHRRHDLGQSRSSASRTPAGTSRARPWPCSARARSGSWPSSSSRRSAPPA